MKLKQQGEVGAGKAVRYAGRGKKGPAGYCKNAWNIQILCFENREERNQSILS